MIKRGQIRGFTIKIFKYYLEVVTIKGFPRVISLSKHKIKTIWRLEI